jgi:hypothetical protein
MKKTRVNRSLLLALLLFAGTPAPALADIRPEQVRFEKGRNGATLKGSIKGDEIFDYRLRARAGQILDVNLQADNRSAYFNVLPPDDETALFVGSVSGNSFNGALPRDGEYTVRVYLMRNAARRNESAHYTVNFTMASSKAVSGTAAANPPAIYDASGKIQCAAGKPPLDQWCDFRVVRHFASGSGSAQIWIAHTGTPRHRVLHYANRRFTTDDGAGISAKRQDDNWLVSVGGREFYLIPDALIHGG